MNFSSPSSLASVEGGDGVFDRPLTTMEIAGASGVFSKKNFSQTALQWSLSTCVAGCCTGKQRPQLA